MTLPAMLDRFAKAGDEEGIAHAPNLIRLRAFRWHFVVAVAT